MGNQFDRIHKTFSSLADCVSYIRETFGDNESLNLSSAKVPVFLFRGESSTYPTSIALMQRIKSDIKLPLETRKALEAIANKLDAELQSFLNLTPMLSAGFLQHYGIPTELLDLTSDLDVAAFFASYNEIGRDGLICVLPTEAISNKSIIIDLTQHPTAERPRRQSAYTFFHQKYLNLKDEECVKDLNLKWFAFTLTQEDRKNYHKDLGLLDAHTDKMAGVLQLLLDDYDKTDDVTARWLANHIPPAPFVTKAIDSNTFELVSIKDAGLEYDEKAERLSNYHKWSVAFPDVSPHKLPI